MQNGLLITSSANAIPVFPVSEQHFADWCAGQSDAWRRWFENSGFQAKRDSLCLVPGDDQTLAAVVVGVSLPPDPWVLGGLPGKLPPGDYAIQADWTVREHEQAALGWALGGYRYTRYKKSEKSENNAATARLVLAADSHLAWVQQQAEAIALVRDLINTPASDMMPEHLAQAAEALAKEFGATLSQAVGDELLQQNYPVIHMVGRASGHAPRLLDLRWGETNHPKLTLVGKGVCFDSGGLDLKSANNMRLMKKDMGGAAHVLGLARLIMASRLPVQLRVLVAAVENAVSGNAFRPGDVVCSRQGKTIEIDNTDAEGRLILCDALAEAVSEQPALLVDFSTLTGAARVAVGTEIAAYFCNNETVASALQASADSVHDPLWRLPLYKSYRQLLDSKVADIANSSSNGYAGAITAGLFLQEFVPDSVPWVHFDIMAWNVRNRPGRPEGGEAMGVRAVYDYVRRTLASS